MVTARAAGRYPIALTAVALLVAGCGSSDNADSSSSDAAADEVTPAVISSCLEEAGFTVEEGQLDDDDVEAMKIATFTIYDDAGGAGAVKVYETQSAATEPYEAMAERYGDKIKVGQAGRSFYDWNSDAGADAIEACLS